ncbi:MAG: CdaR family protein [Chloroflexota bacterium]
MLLEANRQETVQIRLEGPDSILQELAPTDFTATVDLSQVTPGEQVTVPIIASGEHRALQSRSSPRKKLMSSLNNR